MSRPEPITTALPQPVLAIHPGVAPEAYVLLVDDMDAHDPALDEVLGELGHRLVRASTAEAALAAVRDTDFALVLLRLDAAPAAVLDAVRLIHGNRRSSHTALLVLPRAAEAFPAEQAYEAGATDVLPAPLARAALKAKADFFAGALRPLTGRRAGDPTPLLAAERELRASEERYRVLFESIDEGVCVVEMLFDAAGVPNDYRFLETNSAFVRHTGLHKAIGKTILELVPGHDTHWFTTYGRVATTGEPVRFVNEAKAMGRWYDVYATRVGGDGSRKVALLFTDITERMRADHELRRLAADLADADRRKTEFLATLAHELRNPLAPIRSGLQVMRMASDPATIARVQDIMDRQLKHMVELVDDLLDIARITRGQIDLKYAWIDLKDVLSAAVETSMPLIEAGRHRLQLEAPAHPLPLYADATRLVQVVSNLLNNAAKYTPPGGAIVLAAVREGKDALVTVRDNGIGIPAASLKAVFEMFTQIGREHDRSGGGLGIGLSLVRSLVELHGGTVGAASAGAGQGSVFSVRLPLAPCPVEQHGLPADAVPAAAARMLRILVVDDNQDAAEMLSALLGLLGHVVLTANDGQQALGAARSFHPHVVFLDIGMPGLDGYEVARRLRADSGLDKVLLVALTGWGADADRKRSVQAGFDLHLTKPVDLATIEAALERL